MKLTSSAGLKMSCLVFEFWRSWPFWGAHASGVWFSASRRKPRPANYFAPEIPGIVGDQSSGATPELACGTRALPIPVSEFGPKQTIAYP
ncbi:MAG TPA: hypothetical protein DCQ92_09430 [Verrucomicrobia subdivision 3 bacterium]|nr:hypothetical protein [Limisphaerales bacterium]